jgi:CheY-like chemotaxis protein
VGGTHSVLDWESRVTKVLIVDDEPEVRYMLAFALMLAGYTVLEAATGAKAWALLYEH